MYLDGLTEAALPKHFSVDEVRWTEDTVCPVGDDSKWLRAVDVFLRRDGGRSFAGAWRLINAVAPPGEIHSENIL